MLATLVEKRSEELGWNSTAMIAYRSADQETMSYSVKPYTAFTRGSRVRKFTRDQCNKCSAVCARSQEPYV